MAHVLLKEGASIDVVNDRWQTPLHVAAQVNHVEMLYLLLEHGAQVNFRAHPRATTAIEEARSYEAVSALISHGARWPPKQPMDTSDAANADNTDNMVTHLFSNIGSLLVGDKTPSSSPPSVPVVEPGAPTPSTFFWSSLLADPVKSRKLALHAEMFLDRPGFCARPSTWQERTAVPDSASQHCLICCDAFTLVNRRHHCRRCGVLVCGPCTTIKVLVKSKDRQAQRTCIGCFNFLSHQQDEQQHFSMAADMVDVRGSVAITAVRGSLASTEPTNSASSSGTISIQTPGAIAVPSVRESISVARPAVAGTTRKSVGDATASMSQTVDVRGPSVACVFDRVQCACVHVFACISCAFVCVRACACVS